MAQQVSFSVQAESPANPEAVYSLLSEGATWPTWSPIGAFSLERPGVEGGESEGAIRVFKTGTVRSREELVDLRPGEALSYTALSGLPMREHLARVELRAEERGTLITWHERFEPKHRGTGWALRWFLRRFVQRCADGLAAYAALGAIRREDFERPGLPPPPAVSSAPIADRPPRPAGTPS